MPDDAKFSTAASFWMSGGSDPTIMKKLVEDRCRGATDTRREYLEQRIDRVLGPHAAFVTAVRLETKPVTVEDEERQEVTIECEIIGGPPVKISFVRRSLALALASAFEGAAYRLSMFKRPKGSASSDVATM